MTSNTGKKILIIEDSRSFAAILAKQIETELKLGYDIAETMADALSLLNDNAQDYFAITVDLHLPDSPDGEIVEELKPFNLPCVVLTGDISDTMREDIKSYTCVSDYILKKAPNSFQYVTKILKRLLRNTRTKVLAVDDSRTSLRIITKVLESQSLTVFKAKSAEEALTVIEKNDDIRLVVSDGELGNMSGIDLVTEIRRSKSYKEVAFIGISGQYSKGQSVDFLKAGANDFLAKPFVSEELITRVSHCLDMLDHMDELKEVSDNQQLLLRMAAHDIRNPLGNLHSMGEMAMSMDGFSEKQLMKLMDLTYRSTKELIALLDDIVAFSSVNLSDLAGRARPQSIRNIALKSLSSVKEAASQKQISIESYLLDIYVDCDDTLIGQVISNLIGNALKFSEPGTKIMVQVANEQGKCRFVVKDEGPGIRDSELSKLFVPFAKLSNKPTSNESSSGLGLAMCKKIVNAHGGEIFCKNNDDGIGASFIFELPQVK